MVSFFEGVHFCLEPQTTIYKWMFGETTISYVKIGNHPIETTIYKWLALGFQVGPLGRSFFSQQRVPGGIEFKECEDWPQMIQNVALNDIF